MTNCSPLLQIYDGTYRLMVSKRRLFEWLNLGPLPGSTLTDERRTVSTKMFLCIKKLMNEVKNSMLEYSEHKKFSDHSQKFSEVLSKIRCKNDLLTKEDKLIGEVNSIISNWRNNSDPLIVYDQEVRNGLLQQLGEKMSEIGKASISSAQTKKPLYIRKLQRQLRENLELASEEQRRYNLFQENIGQLNQKRLNRVVAKLFEGLHKMDKITQVQQEKNSFLRNYINLFDTTSHINLKSMENTSKSYCSDLSKTCNIILGIIVDEKKCFLLLLEYLNNLESKFKSFSREIVIKQDEISSKMYDITNNLSSAIFYQESLSIFNRAKQLITISDLIQSVKSKLSRIGSALDEAIVEMRDFIQMLKNKERAKQDLLTIFIGDKKSFQSINRKYSLYFKGAFECITYLLESFTHKINSEKYEAIPSDEKQRLKAQIAFQKLFTTYFQKNQAHQTDKEDQQNYFNSSRQKIKSKEAEIQNFLHQINIFEDKIDQSNSYSCSLGPKLLIHGKLKIFTSGIYFESNFNKRNLFFGKTKLFIPKQDIYEINKESALIIFADVIEVVTKKGGVYFHALGKREIMAQQLTNTFFPEINDTSINSENPFNDFDGSQSFEENRVKPFLQKLEYQVTSGQIVNLDFRSFFHKYESQTQFSYHGRKYQDFKHFTIELSGGTNIKGCNFTPKIPSYLRTASKLSFQEDLNQQPAQSERSFTYNKEVPMIPLLSRGGLGVCEEKSIFRWAGTKCLVVDIFTTLSGFSLTQGMIVHTRKVYREKQGVVHYEVSATIQFNTSSPINSLLRMPALQNMKSLITNLFEQIKKIQKGKSKRSFNSMKKIVLGDENQERDDQKIKQLQYQNKNLKSLMKKLGVTAIVFYIVTLLVILK